MQKKIKQLYSIALILLWWTVVHMQAAQIAPAKNQKSVTFLSALLTKKDGIESLYTLEKNSWQSHWQTQEEYNTAWIEAEKEDLAGYFGTSVDKMERRLDHQNAIQKNLPHFNRRKNECNCTSVIIMTGSRFLNYFYLCYKPETHKK